MSVDRILTLKLVTDVGDINKKLSGVQGRVAGLGKSFTSFAKAGGLGIALGAIDAVGSALTQGLTDFRASERAGSNLARTWEKLGLKGDDLGKTVDDISGRAIDLGFDDTESVEAFDRLLKKTKDVDTAQALLNAAWDLARAKQIPLGTAVGEVTKLYDGNKKALKAYGVEGVTGLEAVNAAMLTNTGAAAAFAASSEGQWAVMQGKIGEVFETLTGAGLGLLDKVLGPLGQVGDALGQMWTDNSPALFALVDMIGPKIGAVVEKLIGLMAALGPTFATAWAVISPIVDTMGATIGHVLDTIIAAIDVVVALLNGDFSGAFTAAQTLVQSVVDTFTTIIAGFGASLTNMVSTVGTAAGNIASALFDGIVNGIAGLGRAIIDGVTSSIRSGLNALIRVWNDFHIPGASFEFPGINLPNPSYGTIFDPIGKPSIDILGASRFQLWGDVNLPDIPKLAAGGIVGARPGGTLALLGEGRHDEAVVPLNGRSLGGNAYTINVYVSPGASLVEAGRQTVAAIRAYEAREGALWRR